MHWLLMLRMKDHFFHSSSDQVEQSQEKARVATVWNIMWSEEPTDQSVMHPGVNSFFWNTSAAFIISAQNTVILVYYITGE